MSRKDFLLTLAYGLLSLVGITAFLNALGGHNKAQSGLDGVHSGFGSGAYGGPQNRSHEDDFGKSSS